MATLRLTFGDLYNEVAKFLGTYGSSGPSGANLTEAKDIVHSAYRRFLSAYDWSFLKQSDTLTTVSGTYVYELPEDFGEIIGLFQFAADDGYPPVDERMLDDIIEMRSYSDYSSYPEYFAIRAGNYTPETGQQWEIVFYPTPDAAYTLSYLYKMFPTKLSDDNDIPVGTPDCVEALKALCLAEAESRKDELLEVQENKARIILADAIRRDAKRNVKHLGYNPDGLSFSAWEIARGSYRIKNVVYNT